MADEWDGISERRKSPQHYEVMEMIRSEFESREERLLRRINDMQQHQAEIERKLDRWESNAGVIKWTVMVIVSAGATLAAVYDWLLKHTK
jgi:hypothetical protein